MATSRTQNAAEIAAELVIRYYHETGKNATVARLAEWSGRSASWWRRHLEKPWEHGIRRLDLIGPGRRYAYLPHLSTYRGWVLEREGKTQ